MTGIELRDALNAIKDLALSAANTRLDSTGFFRGGATGMIDGQKIGCSVVPNTRGFSVKAKHRCDWYLNGKRRSYGALLESLSADTPIVVCGEVVA